MTTLNQNNLAPLIAAVRDAANLCQRIRQQDVTAAEKGDRSPVTLADYGSQAIIGRAIATHFPKDAVIAEETGAQFSAHTSAEQRQRIQDLVTDITGEVTSEMQLVAWMDKGRGAQGAARTWVIDPIDGTLGFLAGRSYTIAVAALEDDQPVAGILGSPGYGKGWLFYAVAGEAYRVPLAGGAPEPITVSRRDGTDEWLVVESVESKHANHKLMAQVYTDAGFTPTIRRTDGQDKYGLVACGDADLYLRLHPGSDYVEKVWDHAAGVAVVQAAGGVVTDGYGNALDFSHGSRLSHNKSVVVSNGKCHDALIAALAPYHPR